MRTGAGGRSIAHQEEFGWPLIRVAEKDGAWAPEASYLNGQIRNSLLVRAMDTGAPGETRTPDPLVRSQTLYPAELRARIAIIMAFPSSQIPQLGLASPLGGAPCL
jgi:hypothetical protein